MKNTRSLYLQILDLLRLNLRNAKFSDLADGSELTNTQARVLDEWYRTPKSTNEELGKRLALDASSVSRVFTRLVKLNYLSYEKSKKDGRRKTLLITNNGKEFINLHRSSSNRQVEVQSKRLDSVELLSFIKFMKSFADGGQAPKLTVVLNDNELTTQFRRLTYAHGIVSGNFSGSGYPAATLMILSEIEYNSANANELKQILTIPQSTLSVRLKSLSKKDLISSEPHPEDKRLKLLKLSSKGKTVLKHIEKCADTLFRTSLSKYTEKEILNFINLLKKYVGKNFLANERPLGSDLSILPIESEDECKVLRWLLIDILKNSNKKYPLSSSLFNLNNKNFAIKKGDEFVGGVEFDSELHLVNYIIKKEYNSSFGEDDLKEAIESIFPSKDFYFSFSRYS